MADNSTDPAMPCAGCVAGTATPGGSAILGPVGDWPSGLMRLDLLDVPELGKLQSPGTMPIGFFYVDQNALQVLGVVIGIVQG